jgi:hypothetical protein
MDASRTTHNAHHAPGMNKNSSVTKHILVFQQGTNIFPPCLRGSLEPSPPRDACLYVCMPIVFPKLISIKFGKEGQHQKLSSGLNFGSCHMTPNRS